MAEITAAQVKELREKTQAGFADCKKALTECDGDFEKAVDFLRKKGLAAAAKKTSRSASEGTVQSYIHMGGRIGVLIEVNCETDFVAKTEGFLSFVKDVAMQVAAANPTYVRRDEVPADLLAREREIYAAQARETGKPEPVIARIAEGRLEKFYADNCLLEQPFIKEPEKKVQDILTATIAQLGENVVVRRFARFQLGEGLAKKADNFAEEVAAAAGL